MGIASNKPGSSLLVFLGVMKKFPAIRLSPNDILFENEDYIAVYKKSGWLIHQSLDAGRPDLFRALQSYLKHRNHGEEVYLALHHRLDLWTSGVVIFAKSERANPVLAAIFQKRLARKVYQAICVQSPAKEEGELVDFLKKKTVDRKQRMVKVLKGGKKAITKYKCLKSDAQVSLVRFELVTGRMHQIRVQAALAGFPLLGDRLYGSAMPGVEGALLHACDLHFHDPLSETDIHVHAPPPAHFASLASDVRHPESEPCNEEGRGFAYLLFHKPYGVLCQFTPNSPGEACLGDFALPADVYAVGRLDKDSEGLLLLTDDGKTNHLLSHPKNDKKKTYWAQVEGVFDVEAQSELAKGVRIKGHQCRPCQVRLLGSDDPVAPREPPIRQRKNKPTSWIEIVISEGKNRQVRRMTAAVGFPTLRLIRVGIDRFALGSLKPGESRKLQSFS